MRAERLPRVDRSGRRTCRRNSPGLSPRPVLGVAVSRQRLAQVRGGQGSSVSVQPKTPTWDQGGWDIVAAGRSGVARRSGQVCVARGCTNVRRKSREGRGRRRGPASRTGTFIRPLHLVKHASVSTDPKMGELGDRSCPLRHCRHCRRRGTCSEFPTAAGGRRKDGCVARPRASFRDSCGLLSGCRDLDWRCWGGVRR